MQGYLTRTSLVRTIGVAGLGLGLVTGALGGAPAALAQEEDEPPVEESRPVEDGSEMREELYADFTAALAEELGIDDADEVDAAIRVAMMTVVDEHVGDGMLTEGQAEAVKFLIATSDVPIGPGFAPHHGPFMGGFHGDGPGFGHRAIMIRGALGGDEGHFLPGLPGDKDVFIEWIEEKKANAGEDGDARGEERSDRDTSPSDEDEEDDSSS